MTAFERSSRAGPYLISDQLACYQYLHAGGFDIVDMHKNIGVAVIRQDEANSAIWIEGFYSPLGMSITITVDRSETGVSCKGS